MDERTSGGSKVDAVLHSVTFYPQSSQTGNLQKTVPGVHVKTCTARGPGLHDVSVNYRPAQKTVYQSERSNGGRKFTDKQPKSIETARFMKSKYRLIRKPKHTLLPYKRGQLKFCAESGNVIARNRMPIVLNSELSTEKENKMYPDDCSIHVNTKKLNTRGDTARRFFKASFKRRPFTLSMCGLTTSHMKLNHLKQRERNTALRIKKVCLIAANDLRKSDSDVESAAECCNEHSTVSNTDTAFTSFCDDAAHRNTEVAIESSCGNVEHDSGSQNASNAEYTVPNILCNSSDVEECPVASTSDMLDHSQSSSDITVTSPNLKHGTFLFLLSCIMHQHFI